MLNPPTSFHWLQTSANITVIQPSKTLCWVSQYEAQEKCESFIILRRTDLYSPLEPQECCWIDISHILCQNLFHKIANKEEALFLTPFSEKASLTFFPDVKLLSPPARWSFSVDLLPLLRTTCSRYLAFYVLSLFFFFFQRCQAFLTGDWSLLNQTHRSRDIDVTNRNAIQVRQVYKQICQPTNIKKWSHQTTGQTRGFSFLHMKTESNEVQCLPSSKLLTTNMEVNWSASKQTGNLELYSFFVFVFFISSPLCHSDLDYSILSVSTAQKQALTEEYYLKAIGKWCHKNMTDIQSALVHPNCMCLKSNRKKSGLLSLLQKKTRGRESLSGRSSMWEYMFERFHLEDTSYCCTRASI